MSHVYHNADLLFQKSNSIMKALYKKNNKHNMLQSKAKKMLKKQKNLFVQKVDYSTEH